MTALEYFSVPFYTVIEMKFAIKKKKKTELALRSHTDGSGLNIK